MIRTKFTYRVGDELHITEEHWEQVNRFCPLCGIFRVYKERGPHSSGTALCSNCGLEFCIEEFETAGTYQNDFQRKRLEALRQVVKDSCCVLP